MNTLTKRGFAAFTALALITVTAACGSDDNNNDTAATGAPTSAAPDQSAPDTGAPDTGAPDTAAPAAELGGTIDVWIMGDAGPNFSTLVEGFTASTGIDVEVESIPWENVNDKLTTAVASGEGPDVVQIGLSNLAAFQSAGALADLSSYAADHPSLDDATYLDAVASDKINPAGQQLSVPWISDTRVLFYRSDILAAAGITAPPTTWDELHADAAVLAERGDTDYGYYIPQWDQSLPAIFTWQSGGDVADATGAVTFDTDAFRSAADFYLSFYEDGLVPTAGDFDQTQGFISGAAPMLVSGPYLAKAISDGAPDLEGKWSVAPLPKGPSSTTSLFAGSNLGVWNNSAEVQQSLLLLDYLADPATQIEWYKLTNQLPTAKAALADPGITDDPMGTVYAAQLADSSLLPLSPKWDQIAQELLKALNGIALNGDDKASTLTALNTTVAELQK